MMTIIKMFVKNHRKLCTNVLLIFVISPTFLSLIRPGFFPMQDDLQAFRLQQMHTCFIDWQIPCRWVPNAGFDYGYPMFNYYGPSVYYLGEFMHLAGIQIIDAIKILFIVGFIGGALAMMMFLESWFGLWPAFVGAVLYTYVPYKATEVYVRGSLSEFIALSIFPLLFWSSYRYITEKKLKYALWLAISVGLLLLTHNLMSFIFLPLIAIWCLIWIALEKKWTMIIPLSITGIAGLGLAAFYVLPLVFEHQYAHTETLLGGYFDYRQHFVSWRQLFTSNHFGYGSDYLGVNDDLSLSTGIVHWLAGLIALVISIFTFKKHRKTSIAIQSLAFVTLGILFLMHERSAPIWARLSVLAWLQFPWRFLGLTAFTLSTLAAGAVFLLHKKQALIFGILLIVSVFMLHATFFQPKAWLSITDQDKFSGQEWVRQLTVSIFDYLPIYAEQPPPHRAPNLPEVLEGAAQFVNYKKGSNYQIGTVIVNESAVIRLPLSDFPGMKVFVDNKLVDHRHDDCRQEPFCMGLISFSIPAGQHTILATLTNTPIRTISNVLSLLCALLVINGFFRIRYKKDKL